MISIVGAVYALIGVLGYSMFKSDIKGNFDFPTHKTRPKTIGPDHLWLQ